MATTQIADVVVPTEFTAYMVEDSLVSTALFQSGVLVRNGLIDSQLHAGAQQFTVPFWRDLGENPADYYFGRSDRTLYAAKDHRWKAGYT